MMTIRPKTVSKKARELTPGPGDYEVKSKRNDSALQLHKDVGKVAPLDVNPGPN